MELDFWCILIRIPLNVKYQGTEKLNLSSKGPATGPKLRSETLVTADYKHVKISRFAVLDTKFCSCARYLCLITPVPQSLSITYALDKTFSDILIHNFYVETFFALHRKI